MKKWWIAITLTAFVGGCGFVQASPAPTAPTTPPPATQPATPPATQTPVSDVQEQDQVKVTVYRLDTTASQLLAESAEIPKINNDAKRATTVFGLLKQGNQASNSLAPVPAGVELRGVEIKQGTLILDFNSEVTRLQGSTTETMFVDAVNKTMFALFPDVKSIRYLIDGKPAEVLNQLVVKDGFSR